MKLVRPSAPTELRGDLVDSLSDDEHWPVDSLCEEIAERSIQTAGEENALAILDHQREGSIDR